MEQSSGLSRSKRFPHNLSTKNNNFIVKRGNDSDIKELCVWGKNSTFNSTFTMFWMAVFVNITNI